MSEMLVSKIRENLQKVDDTLRPIIDELNKITQKFSKEIGEATEGKVSCVLAIDYVGSPFGFGSLGGYMTQPMPMALGMPPGLARDEEPAKPSTIPVMAAIGVNIGKRQLASLWSHNDILQLFNDHQSASSDIVREITKNVISDSTCAAILFGLNNDYGHSRGHPENDMVEYVKEKLEQGIQELKKSLAGAPWNRN